MRALVVADAHLYKTPDGAVWTEAIYDYDFWRRYLDTFDSISVAARMACVDYPDVKGYLRSDGENVTFKPMPMARSAKEYILNVLDFLSSAKAAAKDEKCAIIRLPSFTALFVYRVVIKKRIPFAIEIVADPSIVKKGIINVFLVNQLKKAAHTANGVAYVTKNALQRNYPSFAHIYGESKEHFEEHYSSIKLEKEHIGLPKHFKSNIDSLSLVHTANAISNDEKGHSVVIKVVHRLVTSGFNVTATFIGSGAFVEHFQSMAKTLGLEKNITFVGRLKSGDEVRTELAKHDVFIFPSKSEGLPRAVIEAMAVGLPCLSTRVGGIPELLSAECLYDPMDVDGFTNAIKHFFDCPEEMERISKENIECAKEYEASRLQSRRNNFFNKLKMLAE